MSEVLALKYRPQKFDEVIGQDQTISQLKSALESGNLGHALIFSGTRGSGKTTTARIIARELNPGLSDAELSMIVTEIDGASNTGVDNVREIIDNIRYARKGHQVIILDEAHMLSKNAFNALLKTLEEPPEGVSFILCTTEPHKLIPTVKSRCQGYEFKDVDVEVLEKYYAGLAAGENLALTPEDIRNVAIKAEGSVRDGLSLLQKYLSGEEAEDHTDKYFALVSAIYSQDTTTALDVVSQLRKSEDARVIIQTLEKWFYWCSLEAFGMKTPVRDKLPVGAAKAFDLPYLQRLFNSCLNIERNFAATPNSKVVLEMGVLELCL
jgi:DNA polymerase-3 subunit gamma/tau